MPYNLSNIVSACPTNGNVGYNNSWLEVGGNTGRPFYAQASYVTNFNDLQISLSASSLSIGSVEINDPDNHDLKASVVSVSPGVGALRVSTQNLKADSDTVSLADINKNNVGVVSNLSALKVYNTNPVSSVNIVNPISTVNFTNSEIFIKYKDTSGNLDAFGRLRTSTPTTLFDSKTLHNKASQFWSQISNGSSSVNFTGENVDASVTLSTSAVGSYAIRQTTQRFNYQPGKSQLAIFTGVMSPVNNAVKRFGLFQSLTSAPYTPNVGLYFETLTTSSSSIAVVQANEGFLVPSVSAVRNDWNIDKLDGLGISGKTLQLSAANIFLIDYEWLGVGRVRYGFVIDGQICYCHEINNAGNVLGSYIRTPNLPLRAEVRQTGSGSANLKMICGTIASEGGSDFTGVTRSVDSGAAITMAANTRKAVLGVRLQHDKLDSVNEILNASALVLASNSGNAASACFKYELLHNPTLSAGGVWQDVAANSNFQYWNGSVDVVSPGTIVSMGYSGAGANIDLSGFRFEKFLRLGCSINGVRDTLFLVITPLQANEGVYGSLTFIESD